MLLVIGKNLGQVPWGSKLSFHLHQQHPIWVLICFLLLHFQISSLIMCLGKLQKMA